MRFHAKHLLSELPLSVAATTCVSMRCWCTQRFVNIVCSYVRTFQTMLTGEKTLIGSGFIRDVYLVDWEGRKLVVKFTREDYEERVGEDLAENIHQWEAAALDAVSENRFLNGMNECRLFRR